MSDVYWLTDEQMERLEPYIPKSHGKPRVDDWRVLSGIVFVNRKGLRWRDAPGEYRSHKTLYNRCERFGGKGHVPAYAGRTGRRELSTPVGFQATGAE